MSAEPAYWVPIGIAVASLVVVPGCVAVFKAVREKWHDARMARWGKLFVPREEIEMQFSELQARQTQQHKENTAYLDTIRAEALTREGRVLQAVDDAVKQNRGGLDTVHKRIDGLFELLARRDQ